MSHTTPLPKRRVGQADPLNSRRRATGSNLGPLQQGGQDRIAHLMQNIFYLAQVPSDPPNPGGNNSWVPFLNQTFIASRGLTPASYRGYADWDLDYTFDIQHDLELQDGESTRDWYWIGFESHRRNRMWVPGVNTSVAFTARNQWVRVQHLVTGYADTLTRNQMNLLSNTTYRIGFQQWTSATTSNFYVGIRTDQGYLYPSPSYYTGSPGAGWQTFTVNVTIPSGRTGTRLVFGAFGTADYYLSAPSVVRTGATMNFDTADQRFNWRNNATGGRAQIVPDGRTTGTPNWAARVTHHSSGGDTMRNRQLAITAGNHSLCFWHRGTRAGGGGTMYMYSGGALVGSVGFTPANGTWNQQCTSAQYFPSGDNQVDFNAASGPYYVDDLSIF